MKKIAAIHDLSGYGRASLTVAIPILTHMGFQVCPLPTAILSAHSEYKNFRSLDLTDYNTRTYDYNNMALDIPFDERDDLGNEHAFGEKYEYALDGDMVEEISEPRSGVLDQLVIASNGETILIPKADADDFRGAMEAAMQITMLADVDDSVVTLYVLKVLYPVD